MLTELDPKPEYVTVTTGTTLVGHCLHDVLRKTTSRERIMDDPKVLAAWAGMVVDSTPAFYVEHLKRLRKNGIQPYFVPAHVHQWELIERLIRAGVYMGPLEHGAVCLWRRNASAAIHSTWMHFLSNACRKDLSTPSGQA